jgi:hypothetical protein
MIEVNNITKIFYNTNAYDILAYFDINELVTEKSIINYVSYIIEKTPMLKKRIVKKNDSYYFEDVKSFDINDYCVIKYTKKDNLKKNIHKLLNTSLNKELKWCFLWTINNVTSQTRLYFKIHHAYNDGPNLVKMFKNIKNDNNNNNNNNIKNNIFKKIYYYLFGTINLFIITIWIFFRMLFYPKQNTNTQIENENIDFIICKSFDITKIKSFTKKHNININDFFYSLMVKTDYLYKKQERNLLICFPISIPEKDSINNFITVVNTINNSYDNNTLFKTVNNRFNNIKYSLYVPILFLLFNITCKCINISTILSWFNTIVINTDYSYSNMIGPTSKDTTFKLTDVHFILKPINNEIIFNIISYDDKINIICSFKKNVMDDKTRFKKCIYEAYENLIQTSI